MAPLLKTLRDCDVSPTEACGSAVAVVSWGAGAHYAFHRNVSLSDAELWCPRPSESPAPAGREAIRGLGHVPRQPLPVLFEQGSRRQVQDQAGFGVGCCTLVFTGGDGFHLDVNWFFKKLVDVNYPSRNKNNWLIGRSSK